MNDQMMGLELLVAVILKDNPILLSYLCCNQDNHRALRMLSLCNKKFLSACKVFAHQARCKLVLRRRQPVPSAGWTTQPRAMVTRILGRDDADDGGEATHIWNTSDLSSAVDVELSISPTRTVKAGREYVVRNVDYSWLRSLRVVRTMELTFTRTVEEFDGTIPDSVRILTVHAGFNMPLSKLPRQLSEFYLIAANFSHSLAGLPPTLKRFAYQYPGKSTDDVAQELKLLPLGLEYFRFKGNKPFSLENLPRSVTEVSVEFMADTDPPPHDQLLTGELILPPSCYKLQVITRSCWRLVIPDRVRHLKLCIHEMALCQVMLPPKLSTLACVCPFSFFTIPIDLPPSITHLKLRNPNNIVGMRLPPNLHTLSLRHHLSTPDSESVLDFIWPLTLKTLVMNNCNFRLLTLPQKLEVLYAGECVHVHCGLPDTVRSLFLQEPYALSSDTIPKALSLLIVGRNFQLDSTVLPRCTVVHRLDSSVIRTPERVRALGYADFGDL